MRYNRDEDITKVLIMGGLIMNKKYFIMVEDAFTTEKRRLVLSENDLLNMKVSEVENLGSRNVEKLMILEHENINYIADKESTEALITRKNQLEQKRKDLILK